MARQLWLLRHAEAEPHGTRSDSERRLTARGRDQARTAGRALKRMGVEFDLVLVSPKARARETAELASEAWGAATRGVIRVHPLLAEDFDAAEARVALDQLEEDACLLLVGHEPDMSRLVGDLAGGSVDMKKGGVAALRLEGARGELLALLRPRDLALVAAVPP